MIHNKKIKSAAALCCLMAISAMTPASATAISALDELGVTLPNSGAVILHSDGSTGGAGYDITSSLDGITAPTIALTNGAGDGGTFALEGTADSLTAALTVAANATLYVYVAAAGTPYAAFQSGSGAITNNGTVVFGSIAATTI